MCIEKHVYPKSKALVGRHVYSTRNGTNPKAPEERHVLWQVGYVVRDA